jgi:methylated-DNA-[protein]-cysteine S-methyltransferase
MTTGYIDTPIGTIGLVWDGDVVTGVELAPRDPVRRTEVSAVPTHLADCLLSYFDDPSAVLPVRVSVRGTVFQERVWSELRTIPVGETRTYGAVSQRVGGSARAVGQACRANPCPIFIPCHRVLAVHGLGGFAGDVDGRKLEVKRWLLRHEGVSI